MTRKVKPEPDAALAGRMFTAQLRAEQRAGRRYSLEEIGGAIAARAGREEPFAPSVVRRWLRGLAEPNRETFQALAELFGVPVGWLAFGEAGPGEATPPPLSEGDVQAEVHRRSATRRRRTGG